MADITINNFYPHQFSLDTDDESTEPQTVQLRIARFTVEQGKAFNRDWARVVDPPSKRFVFRKSDGDEQAKVVRLRSEVFVVDDEEIRRRRVQEMTPADRATFLELEQADATFEYEFLVRMLDQHISVAPWQRVRFETEEGQTLEVRTGADLVRVFGGHHAQLLRFGMAVWGENNLNPIQKKVWRALFTSASSSSEPGKVLLGPRPVAPAAPAENEGSVETEDATASSEPIPSGSIAT